MELENVATGDIDIEDFLNFEEEKSKQVPYIDKLKKEFYPGDACLGCGLFLTTLSTPQTAPDGTSCP